MAKIVSIRNIDEETFRKFRSTAVEERIKLGDAMTMAMKFWIKEKRREKTKIDPKNLLKIKGIIKTKKKVNWSETIDEFLYGLEK